MCGVRVYYIIYDVLALCAAMLLIRCITVAVLYPALSKVGLRCSAKDAVFVSWVRAPLLLHLCQSSTYHPPYCSNH